MSKRKRGPKDDRRRPAIEMNLLDEHDGGGVFVRARRGCSLPFIGGGVLGALLLLALHLSH
jgi:hypothetical protein